MVKLLFGFLLLVNILSCKGVNDSSTAKKTSIDFLKTAIDFGEIKQNEAATATFVFSNSGMNPLYISNVKASCGCTAPNWPKTKIEPGNTDKITIVYDAKHPGFFKKTVSVIYNGTDSPKKLVIKGRIPYPKKNK